MTDNELILNKEDKGCLLNNFPNIKLSYETPIHKKVYNSDYILAIPDGTSCFIWFTTFKNKHTCFMLELDDKNNKNFKDIKIIDVCCSESLYYGTIFYGTAFHHLNHLFFSIEDIFGNKGRNITRLNFDVKLNHICNILKDNIQQQPSIITSNHIIFGLPVICKTNEEFNQTRHTIKYKLASIQYMSLNKPGSYLSLLLNEYTCNDNLIERPKPIISKPIISKPIISKPIISKPIISKQTKIFEIKPDVVNDIYHVYTQSREYVGVACIPDYTTSVMMNKLFRNIKENNDLDALEESDDEEEFENPNADKFVYLNKSYKMVCHFNHKFKKWVPVHC
jgi:hypothetical protein